MYSYANEYQYPLVRPGRQRVRGSRVRYNLNNKKSNHKFSPFADSNSEWYQRHETLWEKFIKDHLLIGKQGFVDERPANRNPPVNQSQHFHVDPRKCKEINIDIKTEGDRSVSISFVTSETNVHNLLPVDPVKYIESGQVNNSEKTKNTTSDKVIKEKSSHESNKLVKQIFKSKKKSKDICIETKSPEYFNHIEKSNGKNCSKKEFRDNVLNLETKAETVETNKQEVKPSENYTPLPDYNSVKTYSVSSLSLKEDYLCNLHRRLQPPKPKLRFPLKEPILRRRNFCPRTVSSKLLFKKHSNTLTYTEVGQGEGQKKVKNTNFCVERVDVINTEKPVLPGQHYIKTNEKKLEIKTDSKELINKISFSNTKNKLTNLKGTLPESKGRLPESKFLESKAKVPESKDKLPETKDKLPESKDKLTESFSSAVKKESLLEVNKKRSDKSYLSTEKNYSKFVKSKRESSTQTCQKGNSFGSNWFNFSKKFNIFKFQKQPILKEEVQKKNNKNKKLKKKKIIVANLSSTEESTVIESRKSHKDDKTKCRTSDMTDATESYQLRNDDGGDGEQSIKYTHYSHKVRHRSPSNSKSKHKSKDVARHCAYCNRSKEKYDESSTDNIPQISDSAFFGPTLDETITNFISCLPFKISKHLGFIHELKPDPDKQGPITRKTFDTRETSHGESRHKSKYYEDFRGLYRMVKLIKNPAARKIRYVIRFLNAKNTKLVDAHRQICHVYRDEDDILQWLNNEYFQLASELAEAKKNPDGKMSPEMYESRRFVLDRLQEILEEKKYIEQKRERQKERKQRR